MSDNPLSTYHTVKVDEHGRTWLSPPWILRDNAHSSAQYWRRGSRPGFINSVVKVTLKAPVKRRLAYG